MKREAYRIELMYGDQNTSFKTTEGIDSARLYLGLTAIGQDSGSPFQWIIPNAQDGTGLNRHQSGAQKPSPLFGR